MEIDRSLIGSRSAPYTVLVERGAIAKFADAIGDPNPLYRDYRHARALGFSDVVAPPTFPVSFIAPEEPIWTRHLDRRRILAGGQTFSYLRPIVAGDELTCEVHFVEVTDKKGRSGDMELLVQEVRGRDAQGRDVYTLRRLTIYRSP